MTKARAFFAYVAWQPCVIPGCREQPEVAHVMGVLSHKTGQPLTRRSGAAHVCVVPCCAAHHRTARNSLHELGERGFEAHHGMPVFHLQRVALTLLAQYVLEGTR